MPVPLTIVVALVARDHDSRFNGLSHTNGFKDVNRPHHIRRIGFHGIWYEGRTSDCAAMWKTISGLVDLHTRKQNRDADVAIVPLLMILERQPIEARLSIGRKRKAYDLARAN